MNVRVKVRVRGKVRVRVTVGEWDVGAILLCLALSCL